MLVSNTRKLTLTLVTYLILTLTFSTTVNATGFSQRGLTDYGHKRLIKKRSPFPAEAANTSNDRTAGDKTKSDDVASGSNASKAKDAQDQGINLAGINVPVIGAAAPPVVPPDAGTSQSAVASGSGSASASVSASASDASASASASDSVSVSSASVSESASSSVSSTSASASVSSSSTVTSESSAAPTSPSAVIGETSAPSDTQSTATLTKLVSATPTANKNVADANNSSNLSSKSKTAIITVLIVVAASIGGVAIIWTIFRKWKLGHSSKFDERLQPIDWQPTHDGDFRPHRNSGMSYSSGFGGYGATSERGHGGSDHGQNLQPIPDHDFTAGAAHLAPVGGYADLARGPSPQPYMQENLSRGPSVTRPAYNTAVPLHHQGGYSGQNGYEQNGQY